MSREDSFDVNNEEVDSKEEIIEKVEDVGSSENYEEIEGDKAEKWSVMEFVYEIASVVINSLVLIAIIFTFLFRLVGVRGDSMNHTLQSGDWLVVQPAYSEPEYKDIVIISQADYAKETLVKRVIAVGGQEVDINFEEGLVYVDGVALEEDYTATLTDTQWGNYIDFPAVVPEGHFFAMGDNRNNSSDSRSKDIGMIENEYVLGKAVGRLFPFGSWSIYE